MHPRACAPTRPPLARAPASPSSPSPPRPPARQATSADGKVVEFVTPPEGAKLGERVTFAGHDGKPAEPNRMDKKKIFDEVAKGLAVGEGGVAVWRGTGGEAVPFMTSAGPCTVASVAPGSPIR